MKMPELIDTKYVYEVQISSTTSMQEVDGFVNAIKHINNDIEVCVMRKGILSSYNGTDNNYNNEEE